jgi:hypothetical protein
MLRSWAGVLVFAGVCILVYFPSAPPSPPSLSSMVKSHEWSHGFHRLIRNLVRNLAYAPASRRSESATLEKRAPTGLLAAGGRGGALEWRLDRWVRRAGERRCLRRGVRGFNPRSSVGRPVGDPARDPAGRPLAAE